MFRGLRGFSPGIAAYGVGTPWDDTISTLAGGDPTLIALTKAIISRESEWNPNAVNPSDPSYGLMQILLGTGGPAPGYTADQLLDPTTNLSVGITFLQGLLERYSIADAISAYNAGSPTSRNAPYVQDVLAYYDWYTQNDPMLASGAAPVSVGTPSAPSASPFAAVGGDTSMILVGALALVVAVRALT